MCDENAMIIMCDSYFFIVVFCSDILRLAFPAAKRQEGGDDIFEGSQGAALLR